MGFKYVFIPASPNDPMQELTFSEDIDDLQKDTFRSTVENYYNSQNQSVDRDVLMAQLKERTGVNLEEKQAKGEINAEVIDRIMSATSVEIFPVMLPTKQVDFVGISVYLDDKGVSKELEENGRMSALIQAAGYPGQTFRGDCFVGRIIDDGEDVWKRVDFTLADCSSDAHWVVQTRKQREKKSSGDMKSLADKMGVNNPETITPDTMNQEAPTGETATYIWRQTGDDIEVTLKKEGISKADKKAVKIVFGKQKLKLEVKGEVIIDGVLFGPIDPDECTWTLSDGVLQVTMMKVGEESWTDLLKM